MFDYIVKTSIAQEVIQAPRNAIDTVAADGVNIFCWRNCLYCIGPESAGPHPGPVCNRKGGPLKATVASFLRDRLNLESFHQMVGPNKNKELDIEAAIGKFRDLVSQTVADDKTIISVESVTLEFLNIANKIRCRPIRIFAEGKYYSTSSYVSTCFGEVSGQHAVVITKHLGISEVVIRKCFPLRFAFFITLANVVADVQKPASFVLTKDTMNSVHHRPDNAVTESMNLLEEPEFCTNSYLAELDRHLNRRYEGP